MPYTDTYPFIHPSRFTHHLAGQSALVTGASRGIGPSPSPSPAPTSSSSPPPSTSSPPPSTPRSSPSAAPSPPRRPPPPRQPPPPLHPPAAVARARARARALLAGAPIDIPVSNAGVSCVPTYVGMPYMTGLRRGQDGTRCCGFTSAWSWHEIAGRARGADVCGAAAGGCGGDGVGGLWRARGIRGGRAVGKWWRGFGGRRQGWWRGWWRIRVLRCRRRRG